MNQLVETLTKQNLFPVVEEELNATQIIDIHTHLFKPSLGAVGLWGIDELVTYHYLEAELFRSNDITPEKYWTLSKRGQADLIWRTLFVENPPVSEATRGVMAVLKALGSANGQSRLERSAQVLRKSNAGRAHCQGIPTCRHQRSGDDKRSA